jgi:REP element-mobilizing transposase RayT
MLPGEQNPRIERVSFQLRTRGAKPETSNLLRTGIHTRGYLPHVKREGVRYFVTFRLADSLPKDVFMKIQAERAERLTRFYAQQDAAEKLGLGTTRQETLETIEHDYCCKLEQYLDKSSGECWLRNPEIAVLIRNALSFFDGKRYQLKAWVVMPNHVHVVLWPMPNHTLSIILHSWKRFTAREANKILNRTGETFWQPETYDHWIRNDKEHESCCRYVINNPVKARLCDVPEQWRWSSAWREIAPKE